MRLPFGRPASFCFAMTIAAAAAWAQSAPPNKPTFPDASAAPAQRRLQDENPTYKVDVKLVSVFVTVNDASGAPVTDLQKSDFELSEDGVKQKIAVFEQQSELPLSIVMELDTSGSVRKDFPLEVESARHFIASILRPQDRLSLLEISEIVQEVVPFTSNLKTIDHGIKRIQMGSGTALFDGIYLGGESLMDRQGRKVIVLITDGGDTMSKTSYPEAVRAAQQAEAIVYSIIVVPIAASAGRNIGGEHALIQLSEDTGGKHYYAENIASLNRAFQQISRELRTQYLLGYYPSQRIADSDFRRIEVSVNHAADAAAMTQKDGEGTVQAAAPPARSTYKVHHRTGYYTSKLR
jgi:Ca-activated chloride channel family protein